MIKVFLIMDLKFKKSQFVGKNESQLEGEA